MRDLSKIQQRIKSVEQRLNKIIHTPQPTMPFSRNQHEKKIYQANLFLSELDQIMPLISDNTCDVEFVSLSNIEKQSNSENCINVELDGEYCKIVIVDDPKQFDWTYFIYVPSVKSLKIAS